jgi:hypothetical protein
MIISSEIAATPKQYFGIAGKFAYLLCESNRIPQVKYNIIRKRCLGVLYSKFPASTLTRGKAQELFETTKIPAFLTQQVKVEDLVEPKAPVKVKRVAKATKPAATKVAKKVTKKVAKKSTISKAASKPTELETRVAFLEGEVSDISENVLTIKSTLEALITKLA